MPADTRAFEMMPTSDPPPSADGSKGGEGAVNIHDRSLVEAAFRSRRIDPGALRKLRVDFYKRALALEEALRHIPEEHRESLAHAIRFHTIGEEARQHSGVDGATKLLWRTTDGLAIESVILRIRSGRTTLCLSSQAGCAARCIFCATGREGLRRNLLASEILDQVVLSSRILRQEGRRPRNIVFMGMGEPLHNEESTHRAIEVLLAPECFAFAPRRVVVSTVGVPAAMVRTARSFPGISLALSLHSARAETRSRLIPTSRPGALEELRAALEEASAFARRPIFIEHLLLDGINDSAEEARALLDYLAGLPVHVNLLPLQPIARGDPRGQAAEAIGEEVGALRPPTAERVAAFREALESAGFPVTLRRSLGSDIAAACGQLAGKRTEATTPLSLSSRRAPGYPGPQSA